MKEYTKEQLFELNTMLIHNLACNIVQTTYFELELVKNPAYYKHDAKRHFNMAQRHMNKVMPKIWDSYDELASDMENDLTEYMFDLMAYMMAVPAEKRKQLVAHAEKVYKEYHEERLAEAESNR